MGNEEAEKVTVDYSSKNLGYESDVLMVTKQWQLDMVGLFYS